MVAGPSPTSVQQGVAAVGVTTTTVRCAGTAAAAADVVIPATFLALSRIRGNGSCCVLVGALPRGTRVRHH